MTPDHVGSIRSNLVAQSERLLTLEAQHPRALDRAAQSHAALHALLAGSVTAIAVGEPRENLGARLRGERAVDLPLLYHLAEIPTRETLEAGREVVRQLAEAFGLQVGPKEVRPVTLGEALARLSESHGEVNADAIRALADSQITAAERSRMRAELEAHKAAVAQYDAALAEVEARERDEAPR